VRENKRRREKEKGKGREGRANSNEGRKGGPVKIVKSRAHKVASPPLTVLKIYQQQF